MRNTLKDPGGAGCPYFVLARRSVHGRSPPVFDALHVPVFYGAVLDGGRSSVSAAALHMSFSLAAPVAPREKPSGPTSSGGVGGRDRSNGLWRNLGDVSTSWSHQGLAGGFCRSWLEIGEVHPSGWS